MSTTTEKKEKTFGTGFQTRLYTDVADKVYDARKILERKENEKSGLSEDMSRNEFINRACEMFADTLLPKDWVAKKKK